MTSVVSFHQLPKVPMDCRPERCAGCPYGGTTVGTRGPEDSPFVIVGESPGSTELMKGYPFAGDSGELLEDTLREVGWDPEKDPQPYIINAVQCYPRDKQNTLDGAVMACHDRLFTQIGKYPRKVILSLGGGAGKSLTGDYSLKITQERGKLWPSPLSELGVVAAVHPAFLMRNGTMFHAWKRDLAYAVALLKGTDPKAGLWSPPMWNIIQTRDEYEALVSRMDEAEFIAGDIETGGKHGAGLHFQKGYIINLGITSNLSQGRMVDIIPGNIIWENEDLTHRLLGNSAKWIWQNGKFDIKFFRYEGIHEARVDHDLMLASYTLNENKGHGLDEIAWDWIGAPKHKDAVEVWFRENGIKKKDWDYGLLPKDLLWKYAAYDISKTYHAFFAVYEAVCKDKHSSKLYHKVLIPASEFLTHMEMKGMHLDLERVAANDKYLLDLLGTDTFEEDEEGNKLLDEDGKPIYKYKSPSTKIQEYAWKHMGASINIGSPKQLQVLLYDKMKLGASGSSTDEDHLIKIQRRHDHPIAANLMQWRGLAKARNTYVKNAHTWPGLDNRVHVTYKLHATTTGRLSSSDPTNLQNWPRDPVIRGEFIPAPGKVFAEVDLNQAELRCLALMSGDPTLLHIYRTGAASIHHITSVALFGEQYTDDQKMRAKAVNFGIVYGRTAPSLAEEFDISVREAQAYIDAWMGRFPVAAKFIARCRAAPNEMRNLVTNFGRKKRWGVISFDNQRNSENESANFPHQSSAHDVTLLAGIECRPVIKAIWDADFVNEIHDALYLEVDENPEVHGPAIAYVQSVMTRLPPEWGLDMVPFIAEAKVGHRWGAKRNAREMGITDEAELAQYMTDFSPTEFHIAEAARLVRNYQETGSHLAT